MPGSKRSSTKPRALPLVYRAADLLPSPENAEKALAFLTVLMKLVLLAACFGIGSGFDWNAHVERIDVIRPGALLFEPLFDHFYDYHPPLAFLAVRAVRWIAGTAGMSTVASVQTVSTLSCCAAFLCLRSALRRLSLLHHPPATAFLYLVTAMPLFVYVGRSVNIESLLLALTTWVLLCSVRIAADPPARLLLPGLLLIAALTASLYTKYTGILALPLPFLAIAFLAPRSKRLRRMGIAAASCACALLLAFPYYYVRNYRQSGMFLPSNTNVFDAGPQADARSRRDADPAAFLLALVQAAPPHRESLALRDLETPRLADTWKDAWMMDRWIEEKQPAPQHPLAPILGNTYARATPFVLAAGCAALLFERRRRAAWSRFGGYMLTYGALLAAALIAYIYANPWAGSLANKGIYIAPAIWPLCYIFSVFWSRTAGRTARFFLLELPLGLLVIFHHLLPVY